MYHTYTHTYTHIYTHIHTHIHTHTYIHTYIHTYTHTHTYIHTHNTQHTHTHTYIYTHTHTYWIFDLYMCACLRQFCLNYCLIVLIIWKITHKQIQWVMAITVRLSIQLKLQKNSVSLAYNIQPISRKNCEAVCFS